MASPLSQAGALAEPSQYAALHTNRFMTGLWTNRNQLRDAATTFLYEKFYSATRFDSLVGGLNGELTPRMTMARRAGHIVYNSQIFPPIGRFYAFREFSTSDEQIRVMADCAGQVFDATGPNRKLNVWNKSAGAGDSTFQSVGNNLFFGNGLDQKQWIQSLPAWSAGATFTPLQYLVDSNNNLQVAEGGLTVGVTGVQVLSNVLTITLDPQDVNLPQNLMALGGLKLTMSGFGGAAFLNGATITIGTVPQGQPATSSNVFSLPFINADYGPTQETGVATSGSGITGGVTPVWANTIGAYTIDGGQQWICKGSSVQDWGIAAPLNAPTVVQSKLPTTFPAWSKNTYFSTCFLIYNSANTIFLVTTFGTTGSVEPVWNNAAGTITADNTVSWTSQGSGLRVAGSPVAAGAFIFVNDSGGTPNFFKAKNAGNTAAQAPVFTGALGSQVIDGGVTWINVGKAQKWSDVTSSLINGSFATIPVQGGGAVVIGVGQGVASGTAIALPTGYSAGSMIAWNSPGTANGVQSSGVFQATSAGGILNASFANRSSGFGTAATSNWAAAAWAGTAAGAVTQTTVGGLQYLAFTTAMGDSLVICAGALANAATIAVPAGGFLATQFQNIAGAASTDPVGNGMNILQVCSLDATLKLTVTYNDNSGGTWHGSANVFGIFWKTGGGVSSQGVTGGGTAILIPVTSLNSLAVIQAVTADAASFGLPAGFGSSTVISTCAMATGILNGSHVAHGWTVSIAGQTATVQYVDLAGAPGIYTQGSANVFSLAAVLATTVVSPAQTVIDSNGNLEAIAISGDSGAAQPAWAPSSGQQTVDNNATWRNTGLTTAARTRPSAWAFSFKSSVTKHVSTASQRSTNVTLDANNFAFLQGQGSTNPAVDRIVIFRIAQGGATLLFEDEIPAPPAGQLWQYSDQLPDSSLNELLPAPVAKANDPPPVGFKPMEYHVNRIFGAKGNVLSWSNAANQLGDPMQSYLPQNFFTLPAKITRCWASTIGLFVFTISDVFLVTGLGTAASPFVCQKYITGLGLLSYDAFTVNKTTPYLMDNVKRVMALDPSAGLIEPGFPIADQFDSLFDATTAQLAWLDGSHGDTALFAGNTAGSWFRMGALSAPESGLVWSPMGTIAAGFKAMSAVEITPGQKALLLGPAGNGQILMRDTTVNTDAGAKFAWHPVIGSVVLAQPGQIAELAFFTLESARVGSRATMGILLGEINGGTAVNFDTLYKTGQDPPLLPASKTLYNDRYAVMQNQQTVLCRHLQIRFDFPAEDAYNEIFTYTLFGAIHNEMRSQ